MYLKYQWLEKRTPRSVDNLRLWGENPRLDPEDTYLTIKDFASEMTSTNSDRDNFVRLCKSIATQGFIPGDPVVVWQHDTNKKYYIAEGNRRVTALKLLRDPGKSPKSIKSSILKLSNPDLIEAIEKIPVCVSPSFEDSEWYISQRNSASSLQTNWSREQQHRWIQYLYKKYDGNIEIVIEKSGLTQPEVEKIQRIILLRDYIKEVKTLLTDEHYQKATSLNFPISTFERFLENQDVRTEWGIEFNGLTVVLKKDKESFLVAYAELIRRMCLTKDSEDYLDSRIINSTDKLKEILSTFPKVNEKTEDKEVNTEEESEEDTPEVEEQEEKIPVPIENPKKKLKNNPFRQRLILPFYYIKTDSYRLDMLFKELQNIPIKLYPNSVAAAMRIFLDLSVLKYIETESFKSEIERESEKSLRYIILKERLEFLKKKVNREVIKIIGKMLNPNNDYSLDVLNGYVHGKGTHYITYSFLNRFWDSMFPLFENFLDIVEKDW